MAFTKEFWAKKRAEKVAAGLSSVRSRAVQSRWDKVREDRESFMRPFSDLPIEKAMQYLEELRSITEEGARLLNQRIGDDKERMKCVTCKKSVDDVVRANGQKVPGYIWKGDYKDANHPEIIRSVYACSAICHNAYMTKHKGSLGSTQ